MDFKIKKETCKKSLFLFFSFDDIDIEYEKEGIQLAITMVMFGNNIVESLTFNNLDEQLKSKFAVGNYILTGPYSLGKFTLKINTRTYTINSNGIIDN